MSDRIAGVLTFDDGAFPVQICQADRIQTSSDGVLKMFVENISRIYALVI